MHKNEIIIIFQFHFCWSRFICRFFFNFVTKWVTYTLDFFYLCLQHIHHIHRNLNCTWYFMQCFWFACRHCTRDKNHDILLLRRLHQHGKRLSELTHRWTSSSIFLSPELLEYHNKRRLTWRRILKKQQDKIHRENSNQRSQTMTKKLHKPILLYFLRTLF